MSHLLSKVLKKLASLWLTLFLLLWVAIILGVERFFGYVIFDAIGFGVTPAFIGLFINLMAAIATNYQIRQKSGLLVFHLALASIALLVALGRLSGFKGNVEVTTGAAFTPDMVETSWAGPWHSDEFTGIDFVQGPFSINYEANMKRRDTQSHVFVKKKDAEGYDEVVVGDDYPLRFEDYRFYTSFNKGFAPVIIFENEKKERMTGSVHMPSYPIHYYQQGNDVSLPVSDMKIDLWLRIDKPIYDENASWQFGLPENPTLIVKALGERYELALGEWVSFKNGNRLRFQEVRPWMGYEIFYDPTIKWVLAASILALFALIWHIAEKVLGKPWDMDDEVLENKEDTNDQ